MPENGDEISVQLRSSGGQPAGTGWLIVPIQVGGDLILEMVPNLLAPRSTIRTQTFERLRALGLVAGDLHDFKTRARTGVLRGLQFEGRDVPDVEFRVREDALFRRTDGYLGRDFFFRHFAEICFNPRTFVMTLRPDP